MILMANSTQVGRLIEKALLERGFEKGSDDYKYIYKRLKDVVYRIHYVGNRTYCITTLHVTIDNYFRNKEKKKNV